MGLSNRFEQAFQFAFELHRDQLRKGSQVPYIAHLMAVASLVVEDGGSEDEAIAALLHDAPEDQGGQPVLDEIRRRFGENVAQIVDGCTDTYETPKPAWRERKERYLAHLRYAAADVRRVSLADKIHNARSILDDLRRDGDEVWGRFKGGKEGSLWYYRALVEVLKEFGVTPMWVALDEVVHRIEMYENPSTKENE